MNRRFEEILGPLFLWSRMEDWVFVERLYRERGAQSCLWWCILFITALYYTLEPPAACSDVIFSHG